ncbi:MAG: hypothetical protein FD123_4191 [Bacteroidetes bacterium]|nr:MAG: hypothetical protein FD123_4191 [Bacteroidota bacterium]
MKTLVFSFLFIATSAFAFDDPFLRLHINQRSYINPGTVCPFCSGSCYLSYGTRHQHGDYHTQYTAQYAAFGNDARNQLHGPWDVSYMNFNSGRADVNAYSARYAYAFEVGDWRAGIGIRSSYYVMKETIFSPEIGQVNNPPLPDSLQCSRGLFDADAGLMITNLHGTYFGFSVRHLAAPVYVLQNEGYAFGEKGSLPRTWHAMAGTKIPIGDHFDISPEATYQFNGKRGVFDGGAMFRYNYRWTAGMSWSTSPGSPHMSFRAGFTHNKFKWITSFEPQAGQWAVETGIVWRFLFQQECTGGPQKPKIFQDWEFGPRL